MIILRTNLEELNDLLEFRKKIYPDIQREFNKDYWKWKFVHRNSLQKIPYFMMRDQNKIVGTLGYIQFPIIYRGRKFNAAHLVDYNILMDD